MQKLFPDPPAAPFKNYWPDITELDRKQLRFYRFFKKKILKGQFVEIHGNTSYCTLYAFECINGLGSDCSSNAIDKAINSLKQISNIYGYEHGFANWISDLYCLKGEFIKAIDYIFLPENATRTHLANKLMNIKYHLKLPLQSPEILATASSLTTFGEKNFSEISNEINYLIKIKSKEMGKDFLQYIGDKYVKEREYSFDLFNGYNGQYKHIYQSKFRQSHYYFDEFCFYAISELFEFCKIITRQGENRHREKIGIPKIGEGWVSETQLYNLLKSHYRDYEIIHHGRPNWIKPQHLDIYFPKENIGIEYQGSQHFKPVEFFGGEEAFEKTLMRDKRKKKLCKDNNCKLIEVLPNYDADKVINKIDNELKRVMS